MICDLSQILRASLNTALSIPGKLGLHPYTVSVIQINEVAIRPGVYSSRQVIEYPLTVDGYAPFVRQVKNNDLFLSNNRLKEGDYAIGPLVRSFITDCGSGGTNQDLTDGPLDGYQTQLYFRIKGPGQPDNGSFYQKIYSDDDSNLTYTIYVRDTGQNIDLTEFP